MKTVKPIAYCSNANCKEVTDNIYNNNCGQCGATLIKECSKCAESYTEYNLIHCTNCGTKIKS